MKFVVVIALLLASAAHAQTEGGGNNTNTGVVPISREEAAKQLPPPVPVIDLSKTALVFNHPDELIRAAVADYLSTIKEPHDQFGNIITKNYKSATAPDRLDTKLVAHITKFVGNRRHIALTPRNALGINQIQERQRQNDIDKIIYDDWARRTREAFKNANGGGGPQGNTNNNTGGGGSGGGGGGGGNGNNSGEQVPNINNSTNPPNNNGGTNANTPGSTEFSSRLEREFGVKIEMQPKAWSQLELEGLEEVLKKLPRRYYASTRFQRKDVILDGDKPEPRILGQASNEGQVGGVIEISNSYNLEGNNGPKLDFPTPPYDKEQAKILHYKATLAHEITHTFQFYGEGKRHANTSTDSQLIKNWATTFGWSFNSATGQWKVDPPERRDERVSNYGATSPQEDMAEAVAYFLFDPKRLKATDAGGRSRYNFVRDVMGVAQQPDAPVTLQTPKQRGLL
jgi:hypothetical protein